MTATCHCGELMSDHNGIRGCSAPVEMQPPDEDFDDGLCAECGDALIPIDDGDLCQDCLRDADDWGDDEDDFEQYIPAGHHVVEDLDGTRFVRDSAEECAYCGDSLPRAGSVYCSAQCRAEVEGDDP